MSTWVAMIAVGAVSYLFRAVPLVVLERVRIGERADRMVRHAGAAAVAALLVGSLGHGAEGLRPAVLVATAVSLVLATRGASMLRIVAAGGATYATMLVVGGLAW